MKHRYFLKISFNGTNYHGWQCQADDISVQQVINEHISLMLREKVTSVGCGRTDAGVHAKNYMLHFNTSKQLDASFGWKLNNFLPKDIAVQEVYLNPDKLHARWDAGFRSYEYMISKNKDPFHINLLAYSFEKLNVNLMKEACRILLEYDDFESFCKGHNSHNHYKCDLMNASWTETEERYIFSIKANRFLRSMVRMIVGTMVDVGRKKTGLDEFRAIIEAKDRSKAGRVMPAKGLYFTGAGFSTDKLIKLE
ncbi:MAG: tRNA pseudouridine(38-40) synthase TruA [Bacteroidetes bacterium]|nr:tRNA pseudouridine(38-40) synthase TruA [Bacteroidota bacterium]